jgi:hypothetical protein
MSVFLLLMLATAPSVAQSGSDAVPFEERMVRMMERAKIPGISIALVEKGKTEVYRAFIITSVNSRLGFVYFSNSENGLGIVDGLIELVHADKKPRSTWNEYPQF